MEPLRILFSASECAPFAKAGGLGDFVGGLPKALFAMGHDVRIVLPRYGFISTAGTDRHAAPLGVPLGGGEVWCGVYETRLPGSGVPVYLLEHDALFGGEDIYLGYGGSMLEHTRFSLLSRGTLQLCRYLDFVPDVVHVHDWPTAWVPMLLNTIERKPPFHHTASVLTIHNLAHQPRFPAAGLPLLGLPWHLFHPDGVEDYGQLNPLKGGLYHATMLSTVSPTYAKEIRTPQGGAGLQHVMDYRAADTVGILNGIDEMIWDPATDRYLVANYDSSNLSGKVACKKALQEELHLEVRPDVPVIGMVSRMNGQKGTDVVAKALDRILAQGAQVVILGSGDPAAEAFFKERSAAKDGRFAAWIGYSERLAHRIEAGADMFLMPSRFEPCGLNQLYSQRYGTLPIVRATGGLEDTVEQCNVATGDGTGFKLYELTEGSLVDTIAWAISVYRDHPLIFRRMMVRSMRLERGWNITAAEYAQLYRWARDR